MTMAANWAPTSGPLAIFDDAESLSGPGVAVAVAAVVEAAVVSIAPVASLAVDRSGGGDDAVRSELMVVSVARAGLGIERAAVVAAVAVSVLSAVKSVFSAAGPGDDAAERDKCDGGDDGDGAPTRPVWQAALSTAAGIYRNGDLCSSSRTPAAHASCRNGSLLRRHHVCAASARLLKESLQGVLREASGEEPQAATRARDGVAQMQVAKGAVLVVVSGPTEASHAL